MALKILDAYEKQSKEELGFFRDNLRSTLQVNSTYDKISVDFEWLDLMEDTIHYLDNILRNPNRFIINEEEIVKIELARRITVESIRHLSKNTNFIQDITDGEVRPSKILNINKEESFDTYENRLIYTLIQHMKTFITIKKKDIVTSSSVKDLKKLEYQAKSTIGQEKVNISLVIDSKIDIKEQTGDENDLSIEDRIAKLEDDISMLSNTEVYKSIEKKRVALVLPPIKKTNVILKNVNFQCAMKLWDFLINNPATSPKREKDNKNYEDSGIMKEYMNDTFLLNYVTLSTLNKENKKSPESLQLVEDLTNNLIERIVELNTDLPEEKLKDIIGEKILIARTKKIASLSEIQNAFSRNIKNYLDKIENFKFEGETL